MQCWVWLIEEFGPKSQYLPGPEKGPENVVADALSRLDKAPSPSDDKEDTDKTHKPAYCFATLDVNFLNPYDKRHLAENVFSGAHKDDIVYPISAQEISKHQQKDQEVMKKLRDKPGYSDTVLEGTDLSTYHNRIYIPYALQEHIVEWYHSMQRYMSKWQHTSLNVKLVSYTRDKRKSMDTYQ
jgi:hypothetical protein